MRLSAPILLLCLLAGCWTPEKLYDNGALTLSLAGEPSVDDDGFCVPLWFTLADGVDTNQTIQDIDLGYGWIGVEVHEHPDWLPDFQKHATDTGTYHERNNFVRPGRAEGVDFWTIKKTAMISGFVNDDGTPRSNRLYFYANEQRGRVVYDVPERGIRYKIQWWRDVDGRPLLRLTVLGTDVVREWKGD